MTTFRAGSATDVGRVRSNNQDSLLVREGDLFAVADGMGGHQGGEVASALALETLGQAHDDPSTLDAGARPCARPTGPSSRRPGPSPDLKGMGTTLTALADVDDRRGQAARDRQRRRLPALPGPGGAHRTAHRGPQPRGQPRPTGSDHRRRGRVPSPAQHPDPGAGHRRGGGRRLLGSRTDPGRPLPDLQRRPVQRGRRGSDDRHPPSLRRSRGRRSRAGAAGERGGRSRQHHRRRGGRGVDRRGCGRGAAGRKRGGCWPRPDHPAHRRRRAGRPRRGAWCLRRHPRPRGRGRTPDPFPAVHLAGGGVRRGPAPARGPGHRRLGLVRPQHLLRRHRRRGGDDLQRPPGRLPLVRPDGGGAHGHLGGRCARGRTARPRGRRRPGHPGRRRQLRGQPPEPDRPTGR